MTAQELGIRISACMTHMARGFDITLKSGHRLGIAPDMIEPGFVAIRHFSENQGLASTAGEEIIFQIGSDVAWMSLVQYAKGMTKEDFERMLTK